MEYDNGRDRHAHGFDAGNIVDGTVAHDADRNEYVVVDDDGIAFSLQDVLKGLVGKKVRVTCVSFESMQEIQRMMEQTPGN